MSAFLPQNDPRPGHREEQLSESRTEYRFNYSHISPLALVEQVPVHDDFSLGWLIHVAERVLKALENRALVEMDERRRADHRTHHEKLRQSINGGRAGFRHLKQFVTDFLKLDLRFGVGFCRPDDMQDYAKLFRSIGLPPIAKELGDDMSFARMRVAGPNPMMIQRLDAMDPRLPLSERDFSMIVQNDSLDCAFGEHRMYLCDYSKLQQVECGDYPHGPKYIYAPLAMFVVDRTSRELRPVAIRCQQTPAADNPVLTPLDGWNWQIAKTVVEVADAVLHESSMHLGRTHLYVEPIIVSTHRQLAETHPLYALLTPHFSCTLAINSAAWKYLIVDGGACDKLFGCTIESTRSLAADAVQNHTIEAASLDQDLAHRGVDNPETLPHYPYRDDAQLYWSAISEWVDGYVATYYETDQEVADDTEVQAWYREIFAADGGRLKAAGHQSKLETVRDLSRFVTMIIHTCSVQHAAVNFPQYNIMSYVPIMPLAGYTPAPTSTHGATEQDFLDNLPPLDMAELQMEFGYLLGESRYGEFGGYGWHHFRDRRIRPLLKQFHSQLQTAGETIEERNQHRFSYDALLPSSIPQSINA